MSTLGDPLRCRVLLLLEGQELTVSEICAVLQLPQSTASRHLKQLVDQGWAAARREGTRRLYCAMSKQKEPAARDLWHLIRRQVASTATAEQDARRLAGVLARRQTRSQEFFDSAAGHWANLRRKMFGRRFDLEGLLGLLDAHWVVGDLGCGTGQSAASLAPFVAKVVAVDTSQAMLTAARRRLERFANVELRQGLLEELPIADSELDAAIAVLVLHHLATPQRALAEAARSLKPGGRLLLVDMLPHDREEYRQQMGHLWLGFGEPVLTSWLEEAGFDQIRVVPLPADPEAGGPALFAASARRAPS
jgi:ArsR family transcriptional regulator